MTDAPASAGPLLEFRRVGKRFGDRVVLDDLSFQVARSEFVLLLGSSGAGKTTVLRLIAALEAPTEGEITVAGQALARIRRRGLPLLRRSPDTLLDYFQSERFYQVVKRARADQTLRLVLIAQTGNHDHRHSRIKTQHALQ